MRKKDAASFDYGDAESRERKDHERLATENPKCIFCPESNPWPAAVLERHHIAGRQFGDELVIVCSNHHRLLSSAQKDHPPKIAGCNDPHEYWAHLLWGIADLLALAVEFLRKIAAKLFEHVKASPAAVHREAAQ